MKRKSEHERRIFDLAEQHIQHTVYITVSAVVSEKKECMTMRRIFDIGRAAHADDLQSCILRAQQ